jgi:hypothetical protein
MTAPFRRPLRLGAIGLDVVAVKRALKKAGFGKGITISPRFGAIAVSDLKRFQHASSLKADGVYGAATHKKLAPKFDARGIWLLQHAKIKHERQVPALPRFFSRPRGRLARGSGQWGLQPWIVPQVKAICKEFGLVVTSGYGGHPPHAIGSDHMWGGACDLAGSRDAMVKATLWADEMRSLGVFRWVGGPAHDADGVETGHSNHVHVSWFNSHASSIFPHVADGFGR